MSFQNTHLSSLRCSARNPLGPLCSTPNTHYSYSFIDLLNTPFLHLSKVLLICCNLRLVVEDDDIELVVEDDDVELVVEDDDVELVVEDDDVELVVEDDDVELVVED